MEEDTVAAFAATEAVYKNDEKSEESKVYRGIVVRTNELNVRPAAGKIDSYVLVDGKYIALREGDEVAVLGEEAAGNGQTWYKISFRWGDKLVVGYGIGIFCSNLFF